MNKTRKETNNRLCFEQIRTHKKFWTNLSKTIAWFIYFSFHTDHEFFFTADYILDFYRLENFWTWGVTFWTFRIFGESVYSNFLNRFLSSVLYPASLLLFASLKLFLPKKKPHPLASLCPLPFPRGATWSFFNLVGGLWICFDLLGVIKFDSNILKPLQSPLVYVRHFYPTDRDTEHM